MTTHDFIILAELLLIIVVYVLSLYTYSRIYEAYKNRKNKLEVLSSEDDVTIIPIDKSKYSKYTAPVNQPEEVSK